MTATLTDAQRTERGAMKRALMQFNAGDYVSDDLYRMMLKRHASEHTGVSLNLCPACVFS